MCNLLPSLAPVWRIFLATLQGKHLFLDSGRPEGVKMTIFKTGRCASYIVNNEWIACGAVLRTVPVQGALGRVLDLDFRSLFEALGVTLAHFCAPLAHFGPSFAAPFAEAPAQVHFHGFCIPRGVQNVLSAAKAQTSGREVKLHFAPLGDALAWVLATFAICEAGEAV